MYPRLLTTPFFTIHTFGVLLAAAYLAALGWLMRGARRKGLDLEALLSLGIWAIVGALVGAKALLAIRSLGDYASTSPGVWAMSLLTSAGAHHRESSASAADGPWQLLGARRRTIDAGGIRQPEC